MKRCPACGLTKARDEFALASKRADGLQSECKPCKRKRDARSYQQNPAWYQVRNARILNRNRRIVLEHLLANPCVDCGESDPVVLEFDHIGPDKLTEISSLVQEQAGLSRLTAEIAKCVVRCCNCHRKMTAKRGNHWRWQQSQLIPE